MSEQYFIAREGEQTGPYTLDQMQQMKGADQLLPTDMAWTEGQEDWLPLSQIVGDTSPTPPPATSLPPPPPATKAKETGKSVLIVRIVLGILLIVAIVIASLSWRANQQYRKTYNKIADLRDDGIQDTLEGFHKIIGRKSDSNADKDQTREETYEWNAIIRKYEIRIKYFMVDKGENMYVILDVSDESGSSRSE